MASSPSSFLVDGATVVTRFIRMPWDEPKVVRWEWPEMKAALAYRAQGLNYIAIADKLAEDGFHPREDTEVAWKLRETEREMQSQKAHAHG